MVDISAIIVSWNTKKLTMDCIRSLESSGGRLSIEIIVVDNASSDGSPDAIAAEFPNIVLIRNNRNLGFASANNIGIRRSTGAYICLINSDVLVPENCLPNMIEHMEQNRNIGVLGPLMRLADGSIGDSCMRFPSVSNWFCRALALDTIFKRWRVFGGFLMTDFRYDRTHDVDVLTGWFWMVRREALQKTGLLDERFFMYGEDIEWCKRFRDAGWRVVFFPEAEAVHYCGKSSAKAPTRFYVEMQRANMQYFAKYHSRAARFGFWVASVLHELVRIAGFALVYLFRPSARSDVVGRIARANACLKWLSGVSSASMWRI
ncbi:MAG: glycosyltransferase family 2 protein [Acidobacteriota bacterium]|nr:glycosyltransferase family 2 protein [Acidobacteriota bacterium]